MKTNMKTIQWAIGLLIIIIAFLAIIGNLEGFLESRFPNPEALD